KPAVIDRRYSKRTATGAVALQLDNPIRRALLVESGDAFFGFGGFTSFEVMAKGAVDVLLHRSRPEFFHQALRITNRAGSALQNRRGNSLGFAFDLAGWDHSVDQADFTGALRVEQLGGQKDLAEIAFAQL